MKKMRRLGESLDVVNVFVFLTLDLSGFVNGESFVLIERHGRKEVVKYLLKGE